MFKDYYSLLEISADASDEIIKEAFKRLAIRWHPDKNRGEDTTIRMQEINEAYIILKDKEARARYDLEYYKFIAFNTKRSEQNRNDSEFEGGKRYEEYHKSPTNHDPYDYNIEDEILSKWMDNARKQANDLVTQTIKDLKGVSNAAVNGFVEGVVNLVIWVIFINLIILIIKFIFY